MFPLKNHPLLTLSIFNKQNAKLENKKKFFNGNRVRKEKLKKLRGVIEGESNLIGMEHYSHASVFVPLFEKGDEMHVLFEKRAANIKQGGEVSFPGGAIETEDGNPLQTALRETEEELGVSADKIKPYSKLGALISPRGIIVHAYIGKLEISSLAEVNYSPREVERVFSLPVSFFENNKPEEYELKFEIHPYYVDEKGERVELLPVKELNLPSRYAEPWRGVKHRVLVYKTPEETIWGMTAMIMNELVKRLGEVG
jgi:8-oxo-dGTP pyrophosphatase MutT (NUDIX family)